MLLPLSGPGGATGEVMRQIMEGYFADINEGGGVFGRSIELMAVPMGETPDASINTLRNAFDTESIFAVVGAYSVGYDEALLGYLRSDNVPLIGPFTLDPGDAFLDAGAFYLFAGFGPWPTVPRRVRSSLRARQVRARSRCCGPPGIV